MQNLRKNHKSTQESMKKSRIYARIKNDFCSRTVCRGVANPPTPTVISILTILDFENKNFFLAFHNKTLHCVGKISYIFVVVPLSQQKCREKTLHFS